MCISIAEAWREKPISNPRTASRQHTNFQKRLIGGCLFMVIQKTALFLKLDTDDPHAFPRHAEMAVKWKHLSSGFMLAFFIFSVHQEEFKKKKKDLWLIVFQGCCFLCSVSSCLWKRFSPCLCPAHWSSFYISGLCVYGPISQLHDTVFCPSVVFGACKETIHKRERKCT